MFKFHTQVEFNTTSNDVLNTNEHNNEMKNAMRLASKLVVIL